MVGNEQTSKNTFFNKANPTVSASKDVIGINQLNREKQQTTVKT